MAFNQHIAIEVDAATGSDSNGGGFDDTTGTPGTNFAWGVSQAVTTYTDLTAAGAGLNVQSPAQPFGAQHVGNIINVTGGTNATSGRYQVLSVTGVVAALDRAWCTGACSNGAGKLGGALATIQVGMNVAFISAGAIADARVYVKKASYTGTVALVNSGGISPVGYRSRVIGYFATHDDDPTPQSGNQPSYAVGSGVGVNGLTASIGGMSFENITLDGTVSSGTRGVKGASITGSFNQVFNSKILGFSSTGYEDFTSVENAMDFGEVTGCVGSIGAVVLGTTSKLTHSWIHKNTFVGVGCSLQGAVIVDNLVTNNSGASSDGITSYYGEVMIGNTIYGNGRDGIRFAQGVGQISLICQRNLMAKNAGFGINRASVIGPTVVRIQRVNFNAFYGNTSGNYNSITAGDNDVSVSANPFVSSDANLAAENAPDWSLNATPAAGASLRAIATSLPGLGAPLSYRDPGVFQHQDSPGARVLAVVNGAGPTSFIR